MKRFFAYIKGLKRDKEISTILHRAYIVLFAGVAILALGVLIFPYPIFERSPRTGMRMHEDVISPFDFVCIDKASTNAKRSEAIRSVQPVYDLDRRVVLDKIQSLDDLFKEIVLSRPLEGESGRKQLEDILPDISPALRDTLMEERNRDLVKEYSKKLLRYLLRKGIYGEEAEGDIKKGVSLIIIEENGESKRPGATYSSADIFALKEIDSVISERLNKTLDKKQAGLVKEITKMFLVPNVTLNEEETKKLQHEALARVEPVVMFRVKAGEVIARKGDIINEEQAIKLSQLSKEGGLTRSIRIPIGSFLLIVVFIGIILLCVSEYHPALISNTKDLLLLGVVTFLILVLARCVVFVLNLSPYLIPVAFASIMIGVFFSDILSLFATFFISILVGVLVGNRLDLVIFYLVGGIVGIFTTRFAQNRADLTRSFLTIGIANTAIILAFGFINKVPLGGISTDVIYGVINGFVSSILALGCLPFFETLFGKTTSFKLLELSDLNNQTMRQLLEKAPGTFHHSVLVANLAESSAREVGANALLAKAGAYYHDIGKTAKPEYFVENQNSESKHKTIKPTLSASILKSHIKDGVELARKRKLPDPIIDIIQEHHGTTLMTYFYHLAQDQEGERVKESEFRYPGPIPQSKEAAIIMLADAAEAAVRTLPKPSATRIQENVKKVINNKFIDSQLDRCRLTLTDLTKIAEIFSKILIGVFHKRVEYPKEGKAPNGRRTDNHTIKEKRNNKGRKNKRDRKEGAL